MNNIQFILKGINGFKADAREQFLHSDIRYSGDLNSFQGIVKTIKQDDKTKTIQIDNVFEVTLLSDKIIQNKSKIWSQFQATTRRTFITSLIGGLAGLAIAIKKINSGLLLSAIGVAIVSLTSFAFSFLSYKRNLEAKNELNKWLIPLSNLIDDCRKLHHHLNLEYNILKNDIEAKINTEYPLIEKMKDKKWNCGVLAVFINEIWQEHSSHVLNTYKINLPKTKILEILDSNMKKFPLLQNVKDILYIDGFT